MNRHSPAAAKQRGIAIISALLIAAVVAVLAGAMLTRQGVFTRTLEAEQSRIQAQWLLQGGLEYSRQLLWEARQKDVLTRLDQPWARAQGGAFEGRLVDEQGKFNLRNLVTLDNLTQARFGWALPAGSVFGEFGNGAACDWLAFIIHAGFDDLKAKRIRIPVAAILGLRHPPAAEIV